MKTNLYIPCLILAIVPLVIATAAAFSSQQAPPTEQWTKPDLTPYEALQDGPNDASATPDDPAGITSDTASLKGNAAVLHQFAELLTNLQRSQDGADYHKVEQAKELLFKKLGETRTNLSTKPQGKEIVSYLNERLGNANTQVAWLKNRETIGKGIADASRQISETESSAELDRSIDSLKQLRQQFPEMAETQDEPNSAHAVTPHESSRLGSLLLQAEFHRDFYWLRSETGSTSKDATQLNHVVEGWKTLIDEWDTCPDPNAHDNDLIRAAKVLLQDARMKWWAANAAEQSNSDKLLAVIHDWLEEARRIPDAFQAQHLLAVSVTEKWLHQLIPSLEPVPQLDQGIEEAQTKTEMLKRGFYRKILNGAGQYRFWPWDKPGEIQAWPKGKEQFTPVNPPARPKHDDFYTRYSVAREAFLRADANGFLANGGRLQFIKDIKQISKEFIAYKNSWPAAQNPVFPWDSAADKWDGSFQDALQKVTDFDSATNNSGDPLDQLHP